MMIAAGSTIIIKYPVPMQSKLKNNVICSHTCMHTHTHKHTYTCVCTHTQINTYRNTHIHKHTDTHTHNIHTRAELNMKFRVDLFEWKTSKYPNSLNKSIYHKNA